MNSLLQFRDNIIIKPIPYRVEKKNLHTILKGMWPNSEVSPSVAKWRRKNAKYALPGLLRYMRGNIGGNARLVGSLYLSIIDSQGKETDYGLISLDLVTSAGAAFVAASLVGTTSLANFHYHGLGSNNASPTIADTTLAEEFSSSYFTPNVRQSGTAVLGITEQTFVSVAETPFSTDVTCAEWGLFSQASTATGSPAGGKVFDRAIFAAQSITVGFAAQTTFTLRVVAG